MSKKLFGSAEVRVNGTLLLTHSGASFDPGGVARATVTGANSVHGFAESPKASKLECEISLRAGQSVSDLGALDDATITFRSAATGQTWVMRSAWSTEPPTLTDATDGGKVKLIFEAPPAEEMLS